MTRFLFLYFKEFAFNLLKYRNFQKAYHHISFEMEARAVNDGI